MKRPLFLFSISLILGIMTAFATDSYLFVILTVLPFLILFAVLIIKFADIRLIIIGILFFYFVGSFEYLYFSDSNAKKFDGFQNKEVIITGIIDSEPDIRVASASYIVKVINVSTQNYSKKVDGKIMFTTLKNTSNYIFKYGSNIEINGTLSLPKQASNPGGFDYKRYLTQKGISATIFAKPEDVLVGQVEHSNIFQLYGLAIRNRIVEVINESLPKEQAGLLNGMLIGYTAGMDKDIQKDFSSAGLSHIMAVSGMNIAFIVFPMAFIFKKIRFKKRISNVIIICTLIIFCFVTGFTPSVLRATLMAITVLSGQLMWKETDVLTSISLAAIVLLISNPYMLFDVGFQLSFTATLSLILFYKTINKYIDFKYIPNLVTDVLSATISAQIGVLPLIAIYFNKISLISIFTNLLVVPLVEIVTILGFIMAILGQFNIMFSKVIGYVNSTFLSFILFVTKKSNEIPYASIRVTTPSILAVVIFYIIILYFLWLKPKFHLKMKFSYYFAAFCFIFVLIFLNSIVHKNMQVVFIDVGEGDSSLIRTDSGKTILIDGGGKKQLNDTESNIGDTVVIPLLLDFGVSNLDMVICTHGHEDHMQGLLPVLKEYEVDNLLLPRNENNKQFKELLDIAKDKRIPTRFCSTGDVVRFDNNTVLKVLYPIKEIPTNNSSLNESSLVLKLVYKDIGILYTGDIDSQAEKELIDSGTDLKSDILKVAHHGSIYSSTKEFLDLVKPLAAVISVGKNNYGHPSEDTIKRLEDENAKVFRTDEDGAVIVSTDGKKIQVVKTLATK